MKKKIAFVFPGQGAQYPGMGKELAGNYSTAKKVFQKADQIKELSALCFNGSEEELKKTTNTQPAILTTSIACTRVLESFGIKADFFAGHSLGEYTALVAAETLTFERALKLVLLRSRLMEEAVPQGVGAMAAILGLKPDLIDEICVEASSAGLVEPANYNCPGQIVIAGYEKGVQRAIELARIKGAKRAIPLAVSGPFHTSLMTEASLKLGEEIQKYPFARPKAPIVANVTAEFELEPEIIKENLILQMKKPVRWEKSVENLYKAGAKIFIEIGPGKVLNGLIRKTVKDVLLLNVEDEASLRNTLKKLEEVA